MAFIIAAPNSTTVTATGDVRITWQLSEPVPAGYKQQVRFQVSQSTPDGSIVTQLASGFLDGDVTDLGNNKFAGIIRGREFQIGVLGNFGPFLAATLVVSHAVGFYLDGDEHTTPVGLSSWSPIYTIEFVPA